jgi:sialate O-acetylesterase
MEMPLNGFVNCPVRGSNLMIAKSAKYSAIRMATLVKNQTQVPLEYGNGSWQICNPETAGGFSAVGV